MIIQSSMNTTSNLRRIQNEVKSLENNTAEYEKMFSVNMVEDDMYHWHAILYGPPDSLYHGYNFKLDIVLPSDYPYSPPRVKFITPIKHVNVNSEGDICLDILKGNWIPSQNIRSILLSIRLLLAEPNPNDPFNSELANLYRKDKEEYIRTIKKACEDNKDY